jgi:DNA-directed RNA polymerase subunit RPC12/RpoP
MKTKRKARLFLKIKEKQETVCPYCRTKIVPLRVNLLKEFLLNPNFLYLQCPDCQTIAVSGMFEFSKAEEKR